MTTNRLRALLVARLSVLTDESTSPGRQLEHCRNTMQARGWTEAGVATDLDVSATKYSPFHRPELGRWLTERAHEWDVIIAWIYEINPFEWASEVLERDASLLGEERAHSKRDELEEARTDAIAKVK